MRKLCLILVGILVLGLVGCSNVKVPEGIDNKSFYSDMVKCLDLTQKTLQTKNTKYQKDMEKIITKYVSKETLGLLIGSNQTASSKDNDTFEKFNKKEQDILFNIIFVSFSLNNYMSEYFKDTLSTDKLIDTTSVNGKMLLKQIQETISSMEIEYEFKEK